MKIFGPPEDDPLLWRIECALDEWWWQVWAPVRKWFEDRRAKRFWATQIATGKAELVSQRDLVMSGYIGFISSEIYVLKPIEPRRFHRLRTMWEAIVGRDFYKAIG